MTWSSWWAPVFRYYPYVPGDYLPAGTRLLHVTDDPAEAARAPVGDSLLADSRLALEGLLERVRPGSYPAVPPRKLNRKLPEPPGPVPTPAEVFATIEAQRPDDAVILIESTSNIAEFHKSVPITRPHSFSLFGSGGLGWALPAAVGWALAERDIGRHRPVLCILGDGAAQYSIQALYTAAQHRLPIVFLVLNNGEYGILKAFAKQQKTPDVPGMDLTGLDIVPIATGYGCAAFRATTPAALAEALREALRRPGPTVLDIPITPAVAPLL
jgi:benzoylformate decarboxylase